MPFLLVIRCRVPSSLLEDAQISQYSPLLASYCAIRGLLLPSYSGMHHAAYRLKGQAPPLPVFIPLNSHLYLYKIPDALLYGFMIRFKEIVLSIWYESKGLVFCMIRLAILNLIIKKTNKSKRSKDHESKI